MESNDVFVGRSFTFQLIVFTLIVLNQSYRLVCTLYLFLLKVGGKQTIIEAFG